MVAIYVGIADFIFVLKKEKNYFTEIKYKLMEVTISLVDYFTINETISLLEF